jgi:hypothetical protein
MASHQVIGIYSIIARARLALEALVVEGMPEDRIAISVDLTEDAIAAEAPGWFGSPRRAERSDDRRGAHSDAGQCGACVVTAEARSPAEAHRIRDIMASLRPLNMRVPALA